MGAFSFDPPIFFETVFDFPFCHRVARVDRLFLPEPVNISGIIRLMGFDLIEVFNCHSIYRNMVEVNHYRLAPVASFRGM